MSLIKLICYIGGMFCIFFIYLIGISITSSLTTGAIMFSLFVFTMIVYYIYFLTRLFK
jgi:hypothetical protein